MTDRLLGTDLNWRTLEVSWAGGAIHSEPAGFGAVGFDDSAWIAATVPGDPSSRWYDLVNADFILSAARANSRLSGCTFLARREFSVGGSLDPSLVARGGLTADGTPFTITTGTDHQGFAGAAWLTNPAASTHGIGDKFIIVYRHGTTHLAGGNLVYRIATVTSTTPWTFTVGAEATLEDVANDLRPQGPSVSVLDIGGGDYRVLVTADEFDGTINKLTHVMMSTVASSAVTTSSGWARHDVTLPIDVGTGSALWGRVRKLQNGLYAVIAGYTQGGVGHGALITVTDPTDWSSPTIHNAYLTAAYNEGGLVELPNGDLRIHLRNVAQTYHYGILSTDHGVTWTSPVQLFAAGGFPAWEILNSGIGATSYRSVANLAQTDNAYRFTRAPEDDLGWSLETILDSAGANSAYADILILDDHHYLDLYSIETVSGVGPANIYSQIVTDSSTFGESAVLVASADNWGYYYLDETLVGSVIADGAGGEFMGPHYFAISSALMAVGDHCLSIRGVNGGTSTSGPDNSWASNPTMVQARLDWVESAAPPPPDAIGWDVYAAADPDGPRLATLEAIAGKTIRIELNGSGKGSFRINRHAAEATAAILAKGNLVKVRIPELGTGYQFGFFLEDGDFALLSASAEEGGEELHFSGRGVLSYLDRARMWSAAYSTGLDISDVWTKVWATGNVPNPTGCAVDPSDPTYAWVIRGDTRRIYKVRESDRKVMSISPAIFAGWAGGLCIDPADATIWWAIETPWIVGSSSHTKIHKVRRSDYAILATYDLGSAIQLTDIQADASNLWTTRNDGTVSLYKRSKVDGSVVTGYTITYGGVVQTGATGSGVNGTEIAIYYYGKGRALIATIAALPTISRKIVTVGVNTFGGPWTTEGGQDFFYLVSYVTDQTVKYEVTTATPRDPLDGIWRLDEGTPGAILARLMAEWQHPSRPQQPIPDATYAFDFVDDSDGDPWNTNDGTLEFNANVGDLGMATVLKLLPYGLVVQMSPDLVLGGYNTFGTDRSAGAFGAGKVRLVAGTNIGEELKRRLDTRRVDSHMLAKGDAGLYATGTEDDLGYVREGFVSTQLKDAAALAGTAVATLADERVTADSIAFVVEWGDDELVGLYLPWVHYWIGDLVRVHTGTGPFDYDETDWTVYAITLEEQDNATWRSIVELGAGFIDSGSSATGSSGTTAGGGSSSGTGGGAPKATPITVRDTTSGDSFAGTTIEGDFGVSQPSDGIVEITLRTPDGAIEVQGDGVDVVPAATALDVGRGLAASDEGDSVAGLAVDESEMEAADLGTSETNRAKVLSPDGSGGVTWADQAATDTTADKHVHVVDEQFNGDGATVAFNLANEARPDSVTARVAGTWTAVTLGGTYNNVVTFAMAPVAGANNISIDYAAVVA